MDKGLESELATIRTELLGDGDSDAWKVIPAKGLGKTRCSRKFDRLKDWRRDTTKAKSGGDLPRR